MTAFLATLLTNTMATGNIIGIVDFGEPKLKRRVELASGLATLVAVMVFGTMLELRGFTALYILIIAGLLIPATLLHEGLHYLFQCRLSKERPRIGFKFPFPYSALSPTSSVTRNQAIVTALAPALIITPCLVIPALFAPQLIRVLLLAGASIELASCYGDFYITHRLLKCPSICRVRNEHLRNILFMPVS